VGVTDINLTVSTLGEILYEEVDHSDTVMTSAEAALASALGTVTIWDSLDVGGSTESWVNVSKGSGTWTTLER